MTNVMIFKDSVVLIDGGYTFIIAKEEGNIHTSWFESENVTCKSPDDAQYVTTIEVPDEDLYIIEDFPTCPHLTWKEYINVVMKLGKDAKCKKV